MWPHGFQSRCRCGSREPSPGAVPVTMWHGRAQSRCRCGQRTDEVDADFERVEELGILCRVPSPATASDVCQSPRRVRRFAATCGVWPARPLQQRPAGRHGLVPYGIGCMLGPAPAGGMSCESTWCHMLSSFTLCTPTPSPPTRTCTGGHSLGRIAAAACLLSCAGAADTPQRLRSWAAASVAVPATGRTVGRQR